MVELVLRDVDIRHIGIAPVEKMRQNHPVYRLMTDNHNVVGVPI